MSFGTKTVIPATPSNIGGIVAKYRARLKSHDNTPTFLTQIHDSELELLLDLAQAVLAADKGELLCS